MKLNDLHPRDQLVDIMNRIYHSGLTTLSGGNLSIREDSGAIWITPAGGDKGRLTAADIICVHPDGRIEGAHPPSTEYPFHRAIYGRRPDLRAIVHAHPTALVSFSIARVVPDNRIIPQARRVCGPIGYAPYALTGSEQLGRVIADTFAEGFDVVLLENHGIVTGGGTVLEAFQRLETLEFCARTQAQAQGIGRLRSLSDDELALFDRRDAHLPEFAPDPPDGREAALRRELADFVQRGCARQLMISTEGVASVRLGADRFLITPFGEDRREITPADLVLVDGGRREAGKRPSRSAAIHRAIYERHPEVGSVFLSQAPSAMAYAVSDGHFDTRTIAESYIYLRAIPRVPFATVYEAPEAVAAAVTPRTPVLLLENDSLLVVGGTILQAFDRLEVAEYSARALIGTGAIGPLVPITAGDVADLDRAFNLP